MHAMVGEWEERGRGADVVRLNLLSEATGERWEALIREFLAWRRASQAEPKL